MPAHAAICRMLSWSGLLDEWGGWKQKCGGFDLQVKLPGSTPRNDSSGGLKVRLHLGGGGRRGPASDAEARQLDTAAKVQPFSWLNPAQLAVLVQRGGHY
jgi:hypothetical protein